MRFSQKIRNQEEKVVHRNMIMPVNEEFKLDTENTETKLSEVEPRLKVGKKSKGEPRKKEKDRHPLDVVSNSSLVQCILNIVYFNIRDVGCRC